MWEILLERVKRQNWAIEPGKNFRQNSSNFPRADDADGFAVHVEAEEAIEREVTFPHAIVSAMQPAI